MYVASSVGQGLKLFINANRHMYTSFPVSLQLIVTYLAGLCIVCTCTYSAGGTKKLSINEGPYKLSTQQLSLYINYSFAKPPLSS